MKKEYYKTLGLKINSTAEEIKQAYHKEALKWHPDINSDIDATSKMKEINEAYYVLSNAERRAEYNSILERERNFKSTSATRENNNSSAYDSIFKTWAQNSYVYPNYPDIKDMMKLRQYIFDMLDGKI